MYEIIQSGLIIDFSALKFALQQDAFYFLRSLWIFTHTFFSYARRLYRNKFESSTKYIYHHRIFHFSNYRFARYL